MATLRKRKCKSCGARFTPRSTFHVACSMKCAMDVAKKKAEKQREKERRGAKRRLKTKRELMKEAQHWFNKYIRLRDAHLPCISCGKWANKWDAGHYLSTGAHPHMRFEEKNCHKQCVRCNQFLSGNLIEYRKGLIKRYGEELVNWLEGHHEPKLYAKDDIIKIKEQYKAKCKNLQEGKK